NVLGNDLGAMSTRKRDQFRAENLGIIFQQFNLLPYLSVTENVVLALQFSQHRKLKMADKLKRAHKMLTALDMPPESMGKMPVADLSVGQQQRVAAARAFVGEAPIIIADEPTSSLDEGRQQEFLDLLFQQADQRGATLLLVTHDQRVASKFDRVLDLRDVCHVTTTAETQ
ncbi:MAG: ATP-binding cassette domain-containing protein, partial [Alphaproteobacteria bacterium]